MQTQQRRSLGAFLTALCFLLTSCVAVGQITDAPFATQFYGFSISFEKINAAGAKLVVLRVSKGAEQVFCDSVITDLKSCTGFSVPGQQPFKNYFVLVKRGKGEGRIYILTKTGAWSKIPGGLFWAAPKDNLMFILAQRDNTNLLIYNLKTMKTIVEKYNCDEFTDWYYHHGIYAGKVVMECGNEPEAEKEISEWMNPVEIEKFEVKTQTLAESHTTEQQLENYKALLRYGNCK